MFIVFHDKWLLLYQQELALENQRNGQDTMSLAHTEEQLKSLRQINKNVTHKKRRNESMKSVLYFTGVYICSCPIKLAGTYIQASSACLPVCPHFSHF